MSEELNDNISWSRTLEDYFCATGEKCRGLSWSHTKAEAMYSRRRQVIDLPSIVLGSVVGFLQVGSTSMFNDPQASSIWLGVASLFVSVLTTVNSYYRWAARAEGHRVNALHYGKLYRYIAVQMGLPERERIRAGDFLNMVKEQYDRLQEVAPPIPTEVIKEFKVTFAGENYKTVARPEELNGLEKIKVYTVDGGNNRGKRTNQPRERVHQEESILSIERRENQSESNDSILREAGRSLETGQEITSSGTTSEGNTPRILYPERNSESP